MRMTAWLFVVSPIIAIAVALTSDASVMVAVIFTLYMWAVVCVILALIALVGVIGRLLGRGLRALRR
jgi:hypothetical protein